MWETRFPLEFSKVKKADEKSFIQLLKTLEEGWEIDQPVLHGATWQSSADRDEFYHFVLRNMTEDKTTLMSLPFSPQLKVFLLENRVNVNAIVIDYW
jgi:hypothetical protein